jgi:pimeloyl-ACP methyl ester carboxylesterase
LQAYFAECAAQPVCRMRYGDPYASMQKLHRQLRQAPQRAAGRDPLSFAPVDRSLSDDEFVALLRLYAYSPLTAALLPLMIDQALQGNYSPLLGQAQLLIDSVTERLTDGMGLSVACAEDAAGLRIDPADAQTLLGTGLVEFLIKACAIWPRGSMPADFHQPFNSALPVLVLAGERDPVTPPRYAEAVVANLPGARLLRVQGQGHAVMGVGCMPRLVAEFVQQLDARRLNARCLETLGPTPSFVDYNGADP